MISDIEIPVRIRLYDSYLTTIIQSATDDFHYNTQIGYNGTAKEHADKGISKNDQE